MHNIPYRPCRFVLLVLLVLLRCLMMMMMMMMMMMKIDGWDMGDEANNPSRHRIVPSESTHSVQSATNELPRAKRACDPCNNLISQRPTTLEAVFFFSFPFYLDSQAFSPG